MSGDVALLVYSVLAIVGIAAFVLHVTWMLRVMRAAERSARACEMMADKLKR